MKFASHIVVASVAAFGLVTAVAEDAAPANAEARHMIARADGAGVPAGTPVALDAYTGRYDAASGVTFVVDREADALTIELPEAHGGSRVRLHAAETRNVFTTEAGVRVVFESDASGRVLGMLLHTLHEVIAAGKAPVRRGIVTIHDLSEEAVSSLRLESLVRSF